jgi:hypothetical protein
MYSTDFSWSRWLPPDSRKLHKPLASPAAFPLLVVDPRVNYGTQDLRPRCYHAHHRNILGGRKSCVP